MRNWIISLSNGLICDALIEPTFGRLICGERCDSLLIHLIDGIVHVDSNIGVAPLATLNEWMLQKFTVFWAITLLLDEAAERKKMICLVLAGSV